MVTECLDDLLQWTMPSLCTPSPSKGGPVGGFIGRSVMTLELYSARCLHPGTNGPF